MNITAEIVKEFLTDRWRRDSFWDFPDSCFSKVSIFHRKALHEKPG
jgi:hypothetical protein